ncbi:small lysine-rich protein 1 [Scyliorhinus canicula]|uniref:small lysine-rich protein 1 n=1 Tax=Scyliorhinus canicula TaxID=7830 RepID=UPI0018F39530|nr:small lysine-rich protein 1 [Scyliorhinus canicula]XP_038667697.1 small lysine-rich protein 1 [Scyliorhinus canicula]XP_038667698.1 small lysine-rich protein 1 [Scyliorhinus canicula]
MPAKSGKAKGKAKSGGSKKGAGGKKGGGGKKKKKGKKEKGSKSETELDIMSPAAMFNLYYISHNVADSLAFRGFHWPGAPKKKGRK